MGIKSVVWSSENSPPKPYPKLMINGYGVVVLFKDRCNGVVVNSGTVDDLTYEVGNYVVLTNRQSFKDYGGSITLENT